MNKPVKNNKKSLANIDSYLGKLPFGYSYQKIIYNNANTPIDFEFIYINSAFEQITKIKKEKLINNKFSDILPFINSINTWFKQFGENIIEGVESNIEHYSKKGKKWFEIQTYSPEKGYYISIITDISINKTISQTAKYFFEKAIDEQPDYKAISDNMMIISNAKFVGFNIFEDSSLDYTTVALSGLNTNLNKGLSILGFNPVGKKWKHDPRRSEIIKNSTTTVFERLSDLTGNVISYHIVRSIETLFKIGDVLIVKILKKDVMLGDFTLLMPKDYKLANKSQIEMYARQVGLMLERSIINKKLLQSEAKYRQITENISDVVWMMDLNFNLTYISPSITNLTGLTQEEYYSKNLNEFYSPESIQKILQVHQAEILLENNSRNKDLNRKIYIELEHLLPNQKSVWLGMIITFLRDVNGNPIGVQGISRDISLQKQAEIKLLESEKRFKTIFYESPVSIIIHDIETNEIIDANEKAYKAYGFKSLDELINNEFWMPPPYSFKEAATYIQKAAKGIPQKFEWQSKTASGDIFWEEVNLKLITINGIKRVIATSIDITETVIIKEQLINNSKNLAEAQRIAKTGSWEWSLFDNKINFSNEMYNILGIKPKTINNCFFKFLAQLFQDDSNIFHKAIQNKLMSFEFRVVQSDGSLKHILSKCEIEYNMNNVPIKMIGTAQDINHITNEELLKAIEQLHELTQHIESIREEERKSLARELHDDLGQALTAIRIELELIKYLTTDNNLIKRIVKVSEMIGQIMRSIQRIMAQLRPDILDDLGLKSAIEWYISEYISRTGIKVIFIMPNEISFSNNTSLNIYRIIQEALTNVAKHSKADNVAINITKTNKFAKIIITDNGIGIKTDKKSNKKSFGIMGMKERAANIKGNLIIKNSKNKGTEIELIIPLNYE